MARVRIEHSPCVEPLSWRYVATITGAWERGLGEAGDRWELDFRLDYHRVA